MGFWKFIKTSLLSLTIGFAIMEGLALIAAISDVATGIADSSAVAMATYIAYSGLWIHLIFLFLISGIAFCLIILLRAILGRPLMGCDVVDLYEDEEKGYVKYQKRHVVERVGPLPTTKANTVEMRFIYKANDSKGENQ